MLQTFFEIFTAFLAVYGGYCLMINLFYILFCGNKSKICIAYRADGVNDNFSEIFFAKKAFLGRSRVIILVECSQGEDDLLKIKEEVSGAEVYRAERIMHDEREFHRK